MSDYILPDEGKQQLFIDCCSSNQFDMIIHVGARGSGKTTMELVQNGLHVNDPNYKGIIFRRTSAEIVDTGLLSEAENVFHRFDKTKYKSQPHTFTFKSGAEVRLRHIDSMKDAQGYRGANLSCVQFDEANRFEWEWIDFLTTTLRGKFRGKKYMVLTANPCPESPFMMALVRPYLNERGFPKGQVVDQVPCKHESEDGTPRYFYVNNGRFLISDDEQELIDKYPMCSQGFNPKTGETILLPPIKYTVVTSNIYDNSAILNSDPKYLSKLNSLPKHERERDLYGGWFNRPDTSTHFDRKWLKSASRSDIPEDAIGFRAWDLACTLPSETNRYPDFTACSPLIVPYQGNFYLIGDYHPDNHDLAKNWTDRALGRFRLDSGDRNNLIIKQGHKDGYDTRIIIPKDSGAAGKDAFDAICKTITSEGFIVKQDVSTKNKLARFEPFSSKCKNGYVYIIRESFDDDTYEAYMTELERFEGLDSSSSRKDDWVDSTSSAFNEADTSKFIPDVVLPEIETYKRDGAIQQLRMTSSTIR